MIYDHMPGGPRINIISENEHVPDIELQIRVIKEIIKVIWQILPFNNTPKLLKIYIVFTVVKMINYLPVKGGVSSILSSKTIMSSYTLHY